MIVILQLLYEILLLLQGQNYYLLYIIDYENWQDWFRILFFSINYTRIQFTHHTSEKLFWYSPVTIVNNLFNVVDTAATWILVCSIVWSYSMTAVTLLWYEDAHNLRITTDKRYILSTDSKDTFILWVLMLVLLIAGATQKSKDLESFCQVTPCYNFLMSKRNFWHSSSCKNLKGTGKI